MDQGSLGDGHLYIVAWLREAKVGVAVWGDA